MTRPHCVTHWANGMAVPAVAGNLCQACLMAERPPHPGAPGPVTAPAIRSPEAMEGSQKAREAVAARYAARLEVYIAARLAGLGIGVAAALAGVQEKTAVRRYEPAWMERCAAGEPAATAGGAA